MYEIRLTMILNKATRCSRARGFTLIELMVALALSLFLIGGLLVTYISGRTAAMEAETLSRMQENIRFASDYLIRDVRNAGFRDHLTLQRTQYELIASEYAKYGADQSELIIRYAGRGACGRVFSTESDLKVIENRYFVSGGELLCEGSEMLAGEPFQPEPPVPLATGVAGIDFEFIRIPGANPVNSGICDFYENDVLADACIGVRIHLEFDDEENRMAELNASFRNVIVDQLYLRD